MAAPVMFPRRLETIRTACRGECGHRNAVLDRNTKKKGENLLQSHGDFLGEEEEVGMKWVIFRRTIGKGQTSCVVERINRYRYI